jgi:hypothetical protein
MENILYFGPAASIQSHSNGTIIAEFPEETTIIIEKTPVNNLDAVNKKYVDNILSIFDRINKLNSLLVSCEHNF